MHLLNAAAYSRKAQRERIIYENLLLLSFCVSSRPPLHALAANALASSW